MDTLVIKLLLLIFLSGVTESSRILALFPYNAKSHFFMFETLLKTLASRGHEVVVVNHFPQKEPVTNYTDINVHGTMPEIIDCMDFSFIENQDYFSFPQAIWWEHENMCENALAMENIQQLIKSDQKFDLIIAEIFGSDCFLGLVHKFKAPFIGVVSSVAYTWTNTRIANPDHPAYISNYFLPYSGRFSFKERLFNSLYSIYMNWAYHKYSDLPTYATAKKYFGDDLPPLWEIAKNTSLILVNSHFSINQPRPTVPGFIEVGGLHIRKPSKLPEEFEKYIRESEHGVIFFSLGSMVRSETIPEDKLIALLDAFSQLPQKFLWRCSGKEIKNLPKNVKVASWMPQRDILEHPNVRAFITHGGLMGTQEAVHCGVPMVVIPLFGDQFLNAESYASKGIAVKLLYADITRDNVLTSLKTVLNPKFRKNVKAFSSYFRDRPLSALDTAIFWTEYVLRHGGARHMRSAAVDMPWYQYILLDVIVFICFVLSFTLFVVFWIVKKFLSLVWKRLQVPKKKKQ